MDADVDAVDLLAFGPHPDDIEIGIGGLVAAKVIGNRHGYGSENLAPYDLALAVIGVGMLWVGWFGFVWVCAI